jgi:hypothetical protein
MSNSILYCILAHDSPLQTLRLFRFIYNSQDFFVIHVDKSAEAAYLSTIEKLASLYDNVSFLSEYKCGWGGFSLVRAMKRMLLYGLDRHPFWSHAVFLSGTHLPLLSPTRIRSKLSGGKSYFTWNIINNLKSDGKWLRDIWDRIEWRFEEREDGRMERKELLGRPEFAYVSGSQWTVLASNHAEFTLRQQGTAIEARLACSNVADESYFQTLLYNSPHWPDCVWMDSTAVFWTPGAWSPRILDLAGYLDVAREAKTFFVRKIAEDLGDEGEVLRAIDDVIGSVECPDLPRRVLDLRAAYSHEILA